MMSPSDDPNAWSQNSADYLRLLMHNVVDYAIFALDTEGRVTQWNEGAQRITGYRSEEVLGHLADLLFTPEDRKKRVPQQEMSQAMRDGRAEDERWHLRKDGSRFWASGILTALKEEDGTLRGFVKIVRDLTEREHLRQVYAAEQARFVEQERQAAVLQERNRIAQELHDTIAQGFVAIHLHLEVARDAATDSPEESQIHIARAQEVAIQSMTETRRTVAGLRPQQLQQQSLAAALARIAQAAGQDTQAIVQFHTEGTAYPLPAVLEDDLLRIAQEALNNAVKHAQAERIDVTLAFSVGQVRLQVQDNGRGFDVAAGSAGKRFGQTMMQERAERIGGALEVTSRPGEGTLVSLTVKPSLPQTRAWLLAALTSMEDAIITANTEGKVTYLNPAAEALTGWTALEAAGQDVATVYDVVDEETGDTLQRLLVDIARGEEAVPVAADIVLIARGGKRSAIQETASPIQDTGGHTVSVVVVFHDDTQQRSLRHNLEKVNARLRESQRETHHRVKNHFQIAASLIEIREGEEETVLAGSLRTLKLHIQSLAHIHDLLTDAMDAEGEPNYTSARDVLEQLIPLIRATVTDRVIRFTGEHVRLSILQSTSLALIVNELALNAIKYGGEEIDITCKAAEGVVVLEVWDKGPGFPEGFDAKLHGKMGLQIVSSFAIRDLNGWLEFENRPEGGACVRLSFPSSQ